MGRATDITTEDFASWYEASFAEVRRAVVLAVGDADLADEAVAESFARALLHWSTVRRAASPRAWVYRVALNEVRSTLRRRTLERRYLRRQRTRTEPAHAPPVEPDPALWQAVAALAPRARTAVVLRYVADLTEREVADVMGVATGTVSATLSQARRRLGELLGERTLEGDRS
jgi:RNA polymerase sigma-70 factor (ECF subfamily)